MKRPYLIILTLALFSNYMMIANGQQSKKPLPKPVLDPTIKVDTNDLKNNILAPYNLFYLSKYLNNPNLNPTETELIYKSLVNLVGKDKLDIVGKNSPYKLIASFKEGAINSKALFIKKLLNEKDIKKNSPGLDSLNDLLERYNRKNDIIADINNTISLLNDKKNKIENIISFLNEKDDTVMGQDSISIIIGRYKPLLENPELQITTISQLKDNLLSTNSSLISNIANENKKIDTSQTLAKETKELFVKIEKKTYEMADILLANGTFSIDAKNYLQGQQPNRQESLQINLTTTTQNAQQSLNYTGLSIPSQSQMIDAMAMFLAKRAKQEAAIWFMDQLRKRVNNPLIYDVFPSTIELLKGLSDYRTANFGSSWRYAISKDFVEMPRNVSKSSWTKQFLTTEIAANLGMTVELGYNIDGLIKARYNYRDIIRQLYLNPTYSPDPNISSNNTQNINQYAQNIIGLLYIATNELFTINDKNYRLLGYEELKTLDKKQWDILMELLKLKYGEVFDNLPGVKENLIINKEKVIAWLSPLLMSLGQFDKINQEQQVLIEKNKSDQMAKSSYNTWSILGQVIANFENYPFGTGQKQDVNQYLENIKDVFEIIENIQEKNFVAAAQNTMGLVDAYYKVGNLKYIVNIDTLKNIFSTSLSNKEITIEYNENKTIKNIKFNNKELSKDDLEFIKYMGKNLQHLAWADQQKFLETSKKTQQGQILSAKKLDDKSLIKLINRIALYKMVSETNNPSEQAAALTLFSGSISKVDTLFSALPKLSEMSYASQLVKLSGFFGDVIASSSSAELANVIESHALPPTSYKLKRKMSSSVDLNAYVGAFAGRIVPIGNSSLNCKWTGGITAPIGVTIRPAGNLFKYLNFNVQLLELGNLVNHYLITPDSAYNKEVHFSEVFSPGANILYNIKNTPIVAFIGGKLLPLKAYYDEGLKKRFNDKAFDAAIFSIGLKIDIPLVNLHSGE
ncbi:hypothetical protein [Sphingobacterium sp. UBA5996]|uniref:hypothetical protein n=1 Tax=Sphingobacterium sp. UBA5996 TaxID=1947505 RepID=UPI0025E72150|nr:hypothetical protein [Sphingobacterium sp. UBA5996]